ncbi:hypothetical protein GCM10017687_23390 [Streptomyces echinatus]
MIRFEDVSVTYEGAAGPTVAGVDLEVAEGELVLLAGPSGVGKSTVLGAVSGLVPHFTGGTLRGRVTVAGRDTRTHQPRELADVVGTVGQDPLAHFVTDTVEDELAYGMESLGLAPEVMRRRVEETLDLLGLAGLRDRPIATLSGGQRQRVAIGSVLTPHPRVLVLDEPTSALDPAAAEEVLAVLQRLVHDLGTTVLMAEHRLERVIQYADRVVLLPAPGAAPVAGTPSEVMAVSPVYPPVVALGRLAGWSPPAPDRPRRPPPRRRPPRTPGHDHTRPCHPAGRGRGRSYRRARVRRGAGGARSARVGGTGAGRRRYGAPSFLPAPSLPRPRARGAHRRGPLPLRAPRPCPGPPRHGSDREPRGDRRPHGPQRRREVHPARLARRTGGTVGRDRPGRRAGSAPHPARGADTPGRSRPPGPARPAVRRHGRRRVRRRRPGRGRRARHLPGPADRPPAGHRGRHPSPGPVRGPVPGARARGDPDRPPLLLLDEPTRGLDYAAKARLVAGLRGLAAEGHAIVLATHDVELAAELAHRVVLLAEGEVIADGPTAEIVVSSPSFAPQVTKILAPQQWLTVTEVREALA